MAGRERPVAGGASRTTQFNRSGNALGTMGGRGADEAGEFAGPVAGLDGALAWHRDTPARGRADRLDRRRAGPGGRARNADGTSRERYPQPDRGPPVRSGPVPGGRRSRGRMGTRGGWDGPRPASYLVAGPGRIRPGYRSRRPGTRSGGVWNHAPARMPPVRMPPVRVSARQGPRSGCAPRSRDGCRAGRARRSTDRGRTPRDRARPRPSMRPRRAAPSPERD